VGKSMNCWRLMIARDDCAQTPVPEEVCSGGIKEWMDVTSRIPPFEGCE